MVIFRLVKSTFDSQSQADNSSVVMHSCFTHYHSFKRTLWNHSIKNHNEFDRNCLFWRKEYILKDYKMHLGSLTKNSEHKLLLKEQRTRISRPILYARFHCSPSQTYQTSSNKQSFQAQVMSLFFVHVLFIIIDTKQIQNAANTQKSHQDSLLPKTGCSWRQACHDSVASCGAWYTRSNILLYQWSLMIYYPINDHWWWLSPLTLFVCWSWPSLSSI